MPPPAPARVCGFLLVTTLLIFAHRPTCWTALIVPVLFGVAGTTVGLDQAHPGLYLGLMLQGVASPMMAAPAFAALMGFKVTFVLLTLVTSSLVIPVTASFYAGIFFDGQVALSPFALVLGKFAGTMGYLTVMWALIGLMPLSLLTSTPLDVGLLAAGLLGLWLVMAAFTAVGVFISALTREPTLATSR